MHLDRPRLAKHPTDLGQRRSARRHVVDHQPAMAGDARLRTSGREGILPSRTPAESPSEPPAGRFDPPHRSRHVLQPIDPLQLSLFEHEATILYEIEGQGKGESSGEAFRESPG